MVHIDQIMDAPELILVTHSTRPRGGVVHTLGLAEALAEAGQAVRIVALGDPGSGFFRPRGVPCVFVPAPPPAPTLEARVAAGVDALEAGLRRAVGGPAILHAQDCLAARAAVRLRVDPESPVRVVIRTAHHVDDFTSAVLIDCQRRSILEPDLVLVVSEHWRTILAAEFGVDAPVVPNGIDPARFPPVSGEERDRFRARLGAAHPDRFVVLTVGGVEPRKGTLTLFRAMAELRRRLPVPPVLAVAGDHSYQDHTPYREAAGRLLDDLALVRDRDVFLLGTLSDAELGAAYGAADAFAFPSEVEGFGLAVLEAAAAGLPLVTSDLAVFTEYLTPGVDALVVPRDDPVALAGALGALAREPETARRLAHRASALPARFTWPASAARHLDLYRDLQLRFSAGTPVR